MAAVDAAIRDDFPMRRRFVRVPLVHYSGTGHLLEYGGFRNIQSNEPSVFDSVLQSADRLPSFARGFSFYTDEHVFKILGQDESVKKYISKY